MSGGGDYLKARRAEAEQMISQLQWLMGRPPRPSDVPLGSCVQLSTCPHFNNCLYLMGFSDRERLSCHLCPVFEVALGRALADGLGIQQELEAEDRRPDIEALMVEK